MFGRLDKTDLYGCIFKILLENKLKIFRWKLLQLIIPPKSHLFKWKISIDRSYNVCKVEEDYDHFFISCKYLDVFSNKINEMLKKSNLKAISFSIWVHNFWQRILSPKLFFQLYWHLQFTNHITYRNKGQRKSMFFCYLKIIFKEILRKMKYLERTRC